MAASAITGQCLCGEVRYRCDEPIENLVLCACRDCRYITGGEPNAAALVKTDVLHITGETKGYTSTGGSGRPMTRHFCPACGTPLFTSFSGRPGIVALKAGTLDEQQSLKVVARIWADSAPPWHDIGTDVPHFPEGFPK